ncbi:MAG: DUF3618 domain-containing protein [Sphingomicrobium sp.]
MNARITKAQGEVDRARAALIETAHELQQRFQPKTLARDAWESAKSKGADMAEDAVDAVKRRPVATGGVIAAIAMFLAREPIKDGVGKLYDAMTSNDDTHSKPKAPSARAAKPKRRAPQPVRKTETK